MTTYPQASHFLAAPSHSELHRFHYNVKAFGAVGNGIANDTAAIQAAIDAISSTTGGTVFFPPGEYVVTSALTTTKNNVTFEGPGAVIANNSGGSVFAFTTNQEFLAFRGLKLIGTNAVSFNGTGYQVNVTFEKCYFISSAVAVRVGATGQLYGGYFRDCKFVQNSGDNFYVVDGGACNNVSFEGCWWQSSVFTSYFRVDSDSGGEVSDILFSRNTFEGPANTNMVATHRVGAVLRLEFNSCHWADFGGSGFSNRPLIQQGSAVNQTPSELTVINCSLYNTDGVIFDFPDTGVPAPHRVTIIGSLLQTAGGGSGPFDFHSRGMKHSALINCNLVVTQASWAASDVILIGCVEAGTHIPLKIIDSTNSTLLNITSGGALTSRVGNQDALTMGSGGANWRMFGPNNSGVPTLDITGTSTGGAIQVTEQSDANAPSSNKGVIYARDNGAGKTQLCVRFATGAVQVLATEP